MNPRQKAQAGLDVLRRTAPDAVKQAEEALGPDADPSTLLGRVNGLLHAERIAEAEREAERLRPRAVFTPMSSYTGRATRWAWKDRIPVKGVTLLGGREGIGKGVLSAHLAAGVSTGTLPGEWEGQPRTVALVGTEDDTEAVLWPRLVAAGADMDRVGTLTIGVGDDTLMPNLTTHLDAMRGLGLGLVVIDPLIARMGDVDTHNYAEVNAVIERLNAWSNSEGCPVLGIIHQNKAGARQELDTMMGSRAFTSGPRSVLAAARDPEDEDRQTLLLAHPKCNVGPMQPTLRMRVVGTPVDTADGPVTAPVVRWEGQDARHWGDVLAAEQAAPGTSQVGDCLDWLRARLDHDEWSDSAEVKREARAEGYSADTVKRASKRLGVAWRNVASTPRRTEWRLPVGADSPSPPPTAPTAPTGSDQAFHRGGDHLPPPPTSGSSGSSGGVAGKPAPTGFCSVARCADVAVGSTHGLATCRRHSNLPGLFVVDGDVLRTAYVNGRKR